jgi:hypothetical protein
VGDPRHNLHAHTGTMAGAQQVLIVNGPVREQVGINCGDGALGPGWRANSTIGRAVRLVIRHALGSVHGEFDRAAFSHPGRYGWCFGEAEEDSPWEPLASDLGAGDGGSTVTAYATTWQASVICHERSAETLLDQLGLMARTGCHLNWLHRAVAADSSFSLRRPFLFVVGREHARVLSAGGLRTRRQVADALHDRLTRPDPALEPVAVAAAGNIHLAYVHATGMQQTWFFAPFQSHEAVTCQIAAGTRSG